jgi:ATP:corrinoid adenosyltransferase
LTLAVAAGALRAFWCVFIEAADLVTEMTEVKHPFQAGIRAQKGIEF